MSTYKLRDSEFYFNDVRIIPSYIMTGANILIEKSKFQMASEDIQTMMKIIYIKTKRTKSFCPLMLPLYPLMNDVILILTL